MKARQIFRGNTMVIVDKNDVVVDVVKPVIVTFLKEKNIKAFKYEGEYIEFLGKAECFSKERKAKSETEELKKEYIGKTIK